MRAAKNSQHAEGIVTSDSLHARKKVIGPFLRRNRRPIIGGVLVLLLVAVGVGGFKLLHRDSAPDPSIGYGNTYSITDKQNAENQVRRFKASPPAASASIDQQVAYYGDLMGAELDAQDYKGVIDNYRKLVTLVSDADLPVNQYVDAAKAYAKSGDSTNAKAVLDRADTAANNLTTDADRKDAYQQAIIAAREEIQHGS
jgi:hypothetical protein